MTNALGLEMTQGGQVSVLLPVGVGDFTDRMTILEIKAEHIKDPNKRQISQDHLVDYTAIYEKLHRSLSPDQRVELTQALNGLKQINLALWQIEDTLRAKEAKSDFGDGFVANARQVYLKNDQRAHIKAMIDQLVGSRVSEVKEHIA